MMTKQESCIRLAGMRCMFIALLFMLAPLGAYHAGAVPRFTLLSGTRCSACHFNPQGSGQRTELGWMMMNQTGAINPESLDLQDLYDAETNSFWDGLLTLGLDARLQMAKLGRPTATKPEVDRRVIPMQLSPYVAIQPSELIAVYGSFNVAGIMYEKMNPNNSLFPGQTDFDAAVQVQPGINGPNLRVGMIQPSIGIRHDDHTMFIRRDAVNGLTLIPPYYNEWGAELTYEGLRWLTLNAGVFTAKNLAEVDRTVDENKPSISGRMILWPQLLDEGINGMVGGSYYFNGDFSMANVFAGIGLADKATIYGEVMLSENETGRKIRNASVTGSYSLATWLALEWRFEHALSEREDIGPDFANAFMLGVQFFPLPYIELRPEYRYMETDQWELGQYAVQLHLFY